VVRQVDVVGAVILRDGLVLCAERGPHGALAGLWEFPGGKVEPGELPHDALVREITEELGCLVEVGDTITTTSHTYPFGVVHLTTFWCRLIEGTPDPSEHASIRWLPAADLGALAWAPADIPAVALIRDQLGLTDVEHPPPGAW
jgi:8-oxo-dGTP diphosphatase